MAQSPLVKREGLALWEAPGNPQPVLLIINKVERYFCLSYLMTDSGIGSPEHSWHLYQLRLGFKAKDPPSAGF